MGIGDLADELIRGVEGIGDTVNETFFEPVVRLGVTGLARAGKTVFITSLVANLLDRGRMGQLAAAGRIEAVFLQPQPDDTVPRFAFEDHLSDITGVTPKWPGSTRAVSQLRLSFRVRPAGLLGGVTGPRTVHLDIVDYPGEWLLDLMMLDMDYAGWSEHVLAKAKTRDTSQPFLSALETIDPTARLDEVQAKSLAATYTETQHSARAAGFSDCGPGRFLLPGELEGSPVLTFAPLPRPSGRTPRSSLWREMERRFDAYKRAVVRPFFRDHFSRVDRQVVLVDVLDALHAGPAAVEDLRVSMAEILSAFRPGRNLFLSKLLMGRRVDRILFAATKADHIHHTQHKQLRDLTAALVRDARDRANFAGARTEAMAIASLRATVEETRAHNGNDLNVVRGTVLETGAQAAFYPGALPDDPSQVLSTARDGAPEWLQAEFGKMRFAPAPSTLLPGDGPPHIRLDKAAQFLFGDKL